MAVVPCLAVLSQSHLRSIVEYSVEQRHRLSSWALLPFFTPPPSLVAEAKLSVFFLLIQFLQFLLFNSHIFWYNDLIQGKK